MAKSDIAMHNKRASCYQLNNKVITPDRNLVKSEEQEIIVAPKVMALLVYFLERPMQVISVQEIAENVWKSPYVTNTAIQRIIGLIRKALGDDKNAPIYIETIAKKGYRLIAEVKPLLTETSAVDYISNHTSGALKGNRTNNSIFEFKSISTVMSLIILIVLAPYFLSKSEVKPLPQKVSLFSSFKGIESEPEISPDDKHVIYIHHQKDGRNKEHSKVYIQPSGQVTASLLTNENEFNYFPKWSNDGNFIITMRLVNNDHSKCHIVKIKLDTTKTKNIEEKNIFNCESFFITGLAWDSEKHLLLFSAIDKRVTRKERLFQFNTATRQLTQLTNSPVEGKGDRLLDFDFNTRQLLFFRDYFFSHDDLLTIELSSLEIKSLYQHTDLINYARIDTKNERLFFISKNKLYQYAINKKQTAVINNSENYRSFDFSAKKDFMVVAHYRNVVDIFERNIELDGSLSAEKSLVDSSSRDYMPSHLHNTDDLVFVSERSGKSQIWLSRKDQSVEQLTDEVFDFRNTTLKSNLEGDKVLFFARNHLYLLDVNSKKVNVINTHKTYSDFPNWSNDGQSVYFNGIVNGEEQIWNIDLASNLQRQITQHGGIMGAESPDGKGLYFTKPKSNGLWYLSFENRQEELIVENFPSILNSGLVVTDRGIIYLENKGDTILLKRIAIPTHKEQVLETFNSSNVFHLSASSNSTKIYYAKTVKNDSDIKMIQ